MGAKYYESELAYLREMGREFALVHPSTAGLLAEKGSDPDVERLLEGFAFLTAKLRERVDDAVPAIVHGLAQLLVPHYLRPIPATSIVQYTPQLKALRSVSTVPRGTRVAAKPVAGTSCEFRTTQPVDLMPLELADAVLDETSANRPTLRLRFETSEAGRAIVTRREGFRLLLHGELSLTATIYLWLLRYLRGVSLRSGARATSSGTVELGVDAVAPYGFDPRDALLPWPTLSLDGYRYLQEFFTLPSKFLFVDVKNLDRAALVEDEFEIAFQFERPPPLPQRIAAENFRLFCTPVINLFECSGDPIKRDPKVYEHLVRAAGIKPNHMEVYEVKSVLGVRHGQVQRKTYPPFVAFTHVPEGRDAAYFAVRPDTSPVDDGTDTYISIVTPRDVVPVEGEEVLSIELVASNRSLPSELQLGEINQTPRGVSSQAPLRNITPVTVPARPKLGGELHWRLLSHMGISRSSLADAEVLRALLGLYNFQRDSSPTTGRVNERRIESIRSAKSEAVTRLMGGAPVRGALLRLEVDEARLGSIGEAFLFGCVIDELLASHVPLNSFEELHMLLHPSGTELKWPARNGQHRIL